MAASASDDRIFNICSVEILIALEHIDRYLLFSLCEQLNVNVIAQTIQINLVIFFHMCYLSE